MEVRDNEQTAIDSLYRISSLVSDTEDPKIALNLILDEIVRVLSPNSASISLINPDTKRLELEVSYGLPEDWGDMDLALGQGITGWTALHGRSIIVPDVRAEPRYISIRPEIRSEMAVPMEDRGIVIGVVNVDSESVDAYSEQSLKILTLLTNEASRVVSRLWLIQQLRTKANQLESLINMGQRLVGELDTDEILEGLAREGRQLLDCHSCALFLITPDKKALKLHHMFGREGRIPVEQSVLIEDSAVSAAIHRRKQVEVTDLAFTEENDFLKIIQNEGLISMLASPVIFGDEVIGVLNAYTRRKYRFNNDEKKVFATLASLGAIAIQNARLYTRVFASEESLRRNDKLTTLGMLAAEIAHEIRNPLTVLKLLFESLDLNFPDEDARQTDVNVIGEKLDQLEEIVERVLSFGRSREGMHSRQDLNQLVHETIRLVRLKLHQQKIELEFQPAAQAILIEVNKGQIQQVLLNLILNATQAMVNGGTIRIATANGEGNAELSITDSGPGIPSELQDKIFESFLTDRPNGTGLGLSISKRILRSHRGDIELASSSPQGSCFRFWIPQHE
ncbi:MAG: GAF domain-containing protein [Opitutales bacterium]